MDEIKQRLAACFSAVLPKATPELGNQSSQRNFREELGLGCHCDSSRRDRGVSSGSV